MLKDEIQEFVRKSEKLINSIQRTMKLVEEKQYQNHWIPLGTKEEDDRDLLIKIC